LLRAIAITLGAYRPTPAPSEARAKLLEMFPDGKIGGR